MFTGIIQHVGTVIWVRPAEYGARVAVDLGPLAEGVRAGSSVAVNGACLTAATIAGSLVEFDIVHETLRRTTFAALHAGKKVNLELPLRPSDRLDGHLVQGHVDCTATVVNRSADRHEVTVSFRLDEPAFARYLTAKGSIAIDGVSLTLASVRHDDFTVALVPVTLAKTTLGDLRPADKVNVETDMLAKIVVHYLEKRGTPQAGTASGDAIEQRLRAHGWL